MDAEVFFWLFGFYAIPWLIVYLFTALIFRAVMLAMKKTGKQEGHQHRDILISHAVLLSIAGLLTLWASSNNTGEDTTAITISSPYYIAALLFIPILFHAVVIVIAAQ